MTKFTGGKSCICWWGITEEESSINCWLLPGFSFSVERINYKRIGNKGISNTGSIPNEIYFRQNLKWNSGWNPRFSYISHNVTITWFGRLLLEPISQLSKNPMQFVLISIPEQQTVNFFHILQDFFHLSYKKRWVITWYGIRTETFLPCIEVIIIFTLPYQDKIGHSWNSY